MVIMPPRPTVNDQRNKWEYTNYSSGKEKKKEEKKEENIVLPLPSYICQFLYINEPLKINVIESEIKKKKKKIENAIV